MAESLDLADMAARIAAAGPPPSGTLRVYGDWFGRPYDNLHVVVHAAADGDILVIGVQR